MCIYIHTHTYTHTYTHIHTHKHTHTHIIYGLPRWHSGKDSPASAADAGDVDSIPGSGRCSGEGNGNPFQDSYLKNQAQLSN